MSVQLPTASFSQMAVMGEPTRTTVSELGEVGLGAAWTAERAAVAAARAKTASIVFACEEGGEGGREGASGRKGGKRTGRRLRRRGDVVGRAARASAVTDAPSFALPPQGGPP